MAATKIAMVNSPQCDSLRALVTVQQVHSGWLVTCAIEKHTQTAHVKAHATLLSAVKDLLAQDEFTGWMPTR